jgi:Fic family protein
MAEVPQPLSVLSLNKSKTWGALSGSTLTASVERHVVYFEAPKAKRLDAEMQTFIDWANAKDGLDPVLRAAQAHLWFATIHSFDDGNGRIARAIADWALARSENSPQRFYSMSAQIRQERNDYYTILERAQKGTLDITEWMAWFLDCLDRAIADTQTTLADVFRKARFWEKTARMTINDRQRLMLTKLLDGFEGKLTSTKWAKLTKSSQDTASRDIQALIERGLLAKDAGGGRSTSYSLVE